MQLVSMLSYKQMQMTMFQTTRDISIEFFWPSSVKHHSLNMEFSEATGTMHSNPCCQKGHNPRDIWSVWLCLPKWAMSVNYGSQRCDSKAHLFLHSSTTNAQPPKLMIVSISISIRCNLTPCKVLEPPILSLKSPPIMNTANKSTYYPVIKKCEGKGCYQGAGPLHTLDHN